MKPNGIRIGLAGLLAFELIVVAYTFASGNTTFALLGLATGAALAVELLRRTPLVAWTMLVVAAGTLARALLQWGPNASAAIRLLVPAGFAWLALAAWRGAGGGTTAILLVAIARTWFVGVYLLGGDLVLAAANVLGAAGAWTWVAAAKTGSAGSRVAPA